MIILAIAGTGLTGYFTYQLCRDVARGDITDMSVVWAAGAVSGGTITAMLWGLVWFQ